MTEPTPVYKTDDILQVIACPACGMEHGREEYDPEGNIRLRDATGTWYTKRGACRCGASLCYDAPSVHLRRIEKHRRRLRVLENGG